MNTIPCIASSNLLFVVLFLLLLIKIININRLGTVILLAIAVIFLASWPSIITFKESIMLPFEDVQAERMSAKVHSFYGMYFKSYNSVTTNNYFIVIIVIYLLIVIIIFYYCVNSWGSCCHYWTMAILVYSGDNCGMYAIDSYRDRETNNV